MDNIRWVKKFHFYSPRFHKYW